MFLHGLPAWDDWDLVSVLSEVSIEVLIKLMLVGRDNSVMVFSTVTRVEIFHERFDVAVETIFPGVKSNWMMSVLKRS